jgi:hypothetical protein
MKLHQISRFISLAAASTLIATLVSPTAALAAGPTNTVLPTISGTLAVDQTVIAGSGSWDVTPSSISYQWNRCSTTEITSCIQITGANTSSLKLLPVDGGNFLRIQVTALSTGGGTTAASAISGRVLTQPTASVVPVITGVVQVGSTLTISNGTWINVIAPTFNYKWQRCSSLEISSCTDISLATSTTYILTNADVASYIRGIVTVAATANNLVATSASEPTSQLISEPTLITSPIITGMAVTDETLTATTGSYNAFPAVTFTYQWQSCTTQDIATCSPISGANQATYRLLAGNVGIFIRVMVTATNNLGGRISPSSLTTKVLATSIPEAISPPVVSGVVKHREILSATDGAWLGVPQGILSYQWQRCSSVTQTNCLDILGETRSSYKLNFADVDNYVRIKVSSSNRLGTASTASLLTNKIMSATQLQSTPFAIGFAQVGQNWIATPGTWIGAESPTFGYQWQKCAALDPNTCTDIAGATQINYIAQSADVGLYLRLKNWIVEQSTSAHSDIVPVKITSGPKTILVAPKPAVKTKTLLKQTTITCFKGKLTKKVTSTVPKCPTGYKKK